MFLQMYYPLFCLSQALIQAQPKEAVQLLCIHEETNETTALFTHGFVGFAKEEKMNPQ